MNEGRTSEPLSSEAQGAAPAITPAEIDLSCRVPLLVLFLSAAVWFLIGSICTLLCSIKFHAPNFLADSGWLTYGRLLPAGRTALLYGGCLQAGLGVGLWLLARLGRIALPYSLPAIGGAVFWNVGVTIAFIGILLGDSTGFEYLELPSYSVLIIFLGYLLLGLHAAVIFHQRRERLSFASQWFLFAAIFWFPWIYSTAELLLVGFPVRGVTQSVIAWWYADSLLVVWLSLTGLAAAFYFIPKLTGRDLHSHYLALFAFWMLLLFGSWGGVPNSAPVPAWMPALSTVARVLMVLTILAVAVNVYHTNGALLPSGPRIPALFFVLFGVGAFLVAGLMRAFGGLLDWDQELHFTWFATARTFLQTYGFFAMVMFGAVYYILPRLLGTEFPSLKLVRAHLWTAALGVLLVVLPLAIGGVSETVQLQNPQVAFLSIVKSTLHFLRLSTVGELLLVVGHLLFLANLAGLVTRFYRARAAAAYAAATANLFQPGEVKP